MKHCLKIKYVVKRKEARDSVLNLDHVFFPPLFYPAGSSGPNRWALVLSQNWVLHNVLCCCKGC